MNPRPWSAAALILALGVGSPAGASEGTRASDRAGEEKGAGLPRENAGVAGREPASQLPRPGQQPAQPPTGAGSAAGAPGAPGMPGTAIATDASVPKAASLAAGSAPFLLQIVGTVQRVDRGARAVQLASSDVRLELGAGAEVIRDGRPATLAEVREGDRIRATTPGAPDLSRVRELDVTSARR